MMCIFPEASSVVDEVLGEIQQAYVQEARKLESGGQF